MTAPTWEQIRDAGRALIDQPECGLAVYPTTRGNVVVAVREANGAVHLACMRHSNVGAVLTALADAQVRAQVAEDLVLSQECAVAAVHLIQRAKGTP